MKSFLTLGLFNKSHFNQRAHAGQRQRTKEDFSWSGSRVGSQFASLSGYQKPVNQYQTENLSTALACVNAISQAIASLKACVYRTDPDGRTIDNDHPLANLIRNGVNDKQSWPEFLEWLMAQTLLYGNGIAEIVTNRFGEIIGLNPIPFAAVNCVRLPNGRMVYDINDYSKSSHIVKRPVRRLLDDEVLHLKDRTDDGLIGRSVLSRSPATLYLAELIQEFETSLFENQARPSGMITAAGVLQPDQRTDILNNIVKAFTGAKNAGKVIVSDADLKWQSMTMEPESLELQSARRLQTEEIARLFKVPPPIIGDYSNSTFTNSETAGRWFAQHTLTPWIVKIEQCFARSLFTNEERKSLEIEIDLSIFLRGDADQRWKNHEIAVRNDILDTNEIRKIEGFNPRASQPKSEAT